MEKLLFLPLVLPLAALLAHALLKPAAVGAVAGAVGNVTRRSDSFNHAKNSASPAVSTPTTTNAKTWLPESTVSFGALSNSVPLRCESARMSSFVNPSSCNGLRTPCWEEPRMSPSRRWRRSMQGPATAAHWPSGGSPFAWSAFLDAPSSAPVPSPPRPWRSTARARVPAGPQHLLAVDDLLAYLLEQRGFAEGNTSTPGAFVIERAFAEQ